ncbi:MAG: hypothetical protein RLY31_3048 [Bacteroidota bacterium]
MAISLKENGFAHTIIGVDPDDDTLDKALRRRIIDEAAPLEEAIRQAELIILATPVDITLSILSTVLDLADKRTVMDVGSTKATILQAVRHHPRRNRFVATHPMAGTEHSGIDAAIPNLFDRKYTVICNAEESDPDALVPVESLYRSLLMKIVYLQGEEHDVHTAYVSHISHISAFALALTVLEKEKDEKRIFELASSGFASTVRLAKSSPSMWEPIFRQNRDNVLDVLDEHISVLSSFRSLLIKKDFPRFRELMEKANAIRNTIP